MVIDVFRKFLWFEPVNPKQGKDVTVAMKKILSKISKPRKYLQTDNGKQFFRQNFKQLMESYKFHHFSSFSNLKQALLKE